MVQNTNTDDNSVQQRQHLFITLYKTAFPAVARYVNKMGGDLDEAKDVFQDALVIYYERSTNQASPPPDNAKGYLMGIARFLWIKRYKQNQANVSFDNLLGSDNLITTADDEPSTERLMHYLQTAGQKCMELLKAFYYDKLPVKKIANLFDYSGERSATVQKYKCLEKVRNTVKEKSLVYEDFVG